MSKLLDGGFSKIFCPDSRAAGVVVWMDEQSKETIQAWKLINKVAIGSAKRGIGFQPVVWGLTG